MGAPARSDVDSAAAVLFDLDGTLVDTVPALAAAANRLRADQSLPPLPVTEYRPHVCRGSRGLVKAALGDDAGKEQIRRFLDYYREDLLVDSDLFPGQGWVLDQLDARDLPWGVVTNKPAWLSEPLLQNLGVLERTACLVCGDQVKRPKPAPDSLLTACYQLGAQPEDVWYVGDGFADARAAAQAGLRFLVAGYGYLDGDATGWGATGILTAPEALLDWLDGLPA